METHNTRDVEEWEREFVEQGADLEHERWAKWQSYLHSKCVEHSDGKGEWVCFPAELFKRWERQIATRYADLSEDEKESDRKEARTYLPLVHQQLQKARGEDIHFRVTNYGTKKVDEMIAEAVQKARQDWLREEIVRLEGEKLPKTNEHGSRSFFVGAGAQMRMETHNQALQAIIDRYQEELNQDNK